MKEFIKLLSIAVLGGFVVLGGQYFFNNTDSSGSSKVDFQQISTPIPIRRVANFENEEDYKLPDLKSAASKTVHAVVYIQTEFTRKSSVYDEYFSMDDYFGKRSQSVLRASGSGVIISSDGYIVTNNHVVQEADKITVTLNDKRTYKAKVIGTNPATDLALLKIGEIELDFVTFGNSDDIQVGDWVLAVGNPYNLTSTVTAGIISAKARNINILGSNSAIESFLQTDAVVNPGNSGGALVDIKGDLVGINAAIASRTGSYIGYSFAIPVSIVKKVVKDLKEFGSVQRAFLGITIKNVDAKLAKEMDLDEIKGVLVETVMEKGAAANSGIEEDAIIMDVNGIPVNSQSELLEKIGLHRPGDKIKLNILYRKKLREYDVILTNRYGTTKLDEQTDGDAYDRIGAQFQDIPKKLQSKLDINNGQQVINLENGLFKTAGIRNDFIILKIGNYIIQTEEDIKTAFDDKSGGILIEGIYPNGVSAYYGIGL